MMTSQTAAASATGQDQQVPVQTKLAAAWAGFMFLYIYVDFLHLYQPGVVNDILHGVVWKFDITQTFAVSALASVAIPPLMILLSTTLPARTNRRVNLGVAALYVPYSAFNLAGGTWLYYYGLGLAVELIFLVFILRTAWTWRRVPSDPVGTPRQVHHGALVPTLKQ